MNHDQGLWRELTTHSEETKNWIHEPSEQCSPQQIVSIPPDYFMTRLRPDYQQRSIDDAPVSIQLKKKSFYRWIFCALWHLAFFIFNKCDFATVIISDLMSRWYQNPTIFGNERSILVVKLFFFSFEKSHINWQSIWHSESAISHQSSAALG